MATDDKKSSKAPVKKSLGKPVDKKTVVKKTDKKKASSASPSVIWDDENMSTTYANVCNVSSTREEVTLLFGINRAWRNDHEDLTVEVSDRVILTPHAAKRLTLLLKNVVVAYEKRFGELKIEGPSNKK